MTGEHGDGEKSDSEKIDIGERTKSDSEGTMRSDSEESEQREGSDSEEEEAIAKRKGATVARNALCKKSSMQTDRQTDRQHNSMHATCDRTARVSATEQQRTATAAVSVHISDDTESERQRPTMKQRRASKSDNQWASDSARRGPSWRSHREVLI